MATIAYVKQKGDGRRLILALSDEGGEVRRLSVSRATYEAIGCPARGETIGEDALREIEREDEQDRAIRHALYLLSFSDNSEAQLARKLRTKGYSSSAVTHATREMVRLGYVREREQLMTLVRSLANGRLYGPRRILAALSAKGYRSADIRDAMERLCREGEIDFTKNFKALEQKRGDGTPEGRRKLQYTYGYGRESV